LWLSGQLGNLPTTKVLASQTIEGQMKQTMDNIGLVLQEYDLNYEDIAKCTLMLADISDWPIANQVYTPYFTQLPARSAFATSGLALGAKVEIECVAEL
jgi:enamine deaminase RidA (YjgF/YER057c/UK114 family)